MITYAEAELLEDRELMQAIRRAEKASGFVTGMRFSAISGRVRPAERKHEMARGQPSPDKPMQGSPCNGCGVCCKAIPCILARDLIYAVEGPCPALEWDGGRYWCGLIRAPHRHIPGLRDKPWADEPIREMLLETGAFGVGCDSEDDPELHRSRTAEEPVSICDSMRNENDNCKSM